VLVRGYKRWAHGDEEPEQDLLDDA
jgi:hypothetical protein